MRIPETPPDFRVIMSEVVREDPKQLEALLSVRAADDKGRYLHWDELRRRKTSGRMSHERQWAGMKLTRRQMANALDFFNTENDQFSYCEPDCVRRRLRWLDLNCGGTVTATRGAASERESQFYLARSIAEEPISSSILEGAATTRARARALIEENRDPRDRAERMVLNNYRAMQEIAELKDEPLTPELVMHIHRVITEGTLENPEKAGVFRDGNDKVDVVDQFEDLLHIPPAADELPARLEKLCAFANGSEEDEPYVHPIARAIILHFMLAYDHPFVDGNGRVARALFYWSALRSGYWLMKYVSISHTIRKAPAQYGKAFLKVETDEGDVTYFLDHQLGVLQKAMEELQSYMERQKKKFINFESLLSTGQRGRFNLRQTALLRDMIRKITRQMTIGAHQTRFSISYLTARSDLEKLAVGGFLVKKKIGQQNFYRPAPGLEERLAQTGKS